MFLFICFIGGMALWVIGQAFERLGRGMRNEEVAHSSHTEHITYVTIQNTDNKQTHHHHTYHVTTQGGDYDARTAGGHGAGDYSRY